MTGKNCIDAGVPRIFCKVLKSLATMAGGLTTRPCQRGNINQASLQEATWKKPAQMVHMFGNGFVRDIWFNSSSKLRAARLYHRAALSVKAGACAIGTRQKKYNQRSAVMAPRKDKARGCITCQLLTTWAMRAEDVCFPTENSWYQIHLCDVRKRDGT